jgi:hypothetical protein
MKDLMIGVGSYQWMTGDEFENIIFINKETTDQWRAMAR